MTGDFTVVVSVDSSARNIAYVADDVACLGVNVQVIHFGSGLILGSASSDDFVSSARLIPGVTDVRVTPF